MTSRTLAAIAMAIAIVFVADESGRAAHPGLNGQIAFVRQVEGSSPSGVPLASHAIYSIAPGGMKPTLLIDAPGFEPTWSPDGARLAFWRDVDPATEFAVEEFELFVAEADGTGVRQLTSNSELDRSPAWSPDGSRIAFVRNSSVWIMKSDGGGERLVSRKGLSVAWSPDGRWLALTRGDRSIWLVRPDGTDRHRIAQSGHYGDKFGWGEPVEWTPDGRIAFVAHRLGLATMTRDGRQRRDVAKRFDGYQPAWSPDGRWVAVKSWDRDGLDLLAADGSRRRVLTRSADPVHDSDPDWQPVCTMRGKTGRDEITGTPRADMICGRVGDDRIDGRGGLDRLFGGPGNDVLLAVDGGFDVVGCGIGNDSVVADRRDLVGVDCERIRRR
jgi:Tol biopolymer transport system component